MSELYFFKNALRDLARPGKMVSALLLVALAVLIAVLVRAGAKPGEFNADETYNNISAKLVFGFILIILSVVFATGAVVQDVERKTIPYLLVRPVPRWRILLVKYLAIVLVTTLIVMAADILTALIIYGAKGITHSALGRDLLILPIGALAYGAFFLLMSTAFSRPLVFGLIYSFVIEEFFSNLPGDWQKLSIMGYLHALSPHLAVNSDTGFQMAALSSSDAIPAWLAWTVLSSVIGIGLIGSLVIFSVKEYTPREDTA